MNSETFGTFLKKKRVKLGPSTREVAEAFGVSATYMFDLERDNRNPPNNLEKLEKLACILELNPLEKDRMYDLVGKARKELAPDLCLYIEKHGYVTDCLRAARDLKATEDDWQMFLDAVKKRRGCTE